MWKLQKYITNRSKNHKNKKIENITKFSVLKNCKILIKVKKPIKIDKTEYPKRDNNKNREYHPAQFSALSYIYFYSLFSVFSALVSDSNRVKFTSEAIYSSLVA